MFIGVGIQPAFAVETSFNSPSEIIEDCNCRVTNNYTSVRLNSLLNRAERLLNRVEIFTNLIPILSKNSPGVIEKCEEISNGITIVKKV